MHENREGGSDRNRSKHAGPSLVSTDNDGSPNPGQDEESFALTNELGRTAESGSGKPLDDSIAGHRPRKSATPDRALPYILGPDRLPRGSTCHMGIQ